MKCIEKKLNPIRYINDTARGLYGLKWEENSIEVLNEENEIVWKKESDYQIKSVETNIGNFSTVGETITIKFEAYFLIYSTTGAFLFDSRNMQNGTFSNLLEEFPAQVIYSADCKPGYYIINVKVKAQNKNYELFDSRGMCVYTGSDKFIKFKYRVLENELLQIKSRDSMEMLDVHLSPISNEASIFLMGDSTVTNQKLPFWGWGQMLQIESEQVVLNYAVSARSLKSFKLEGRFKMIKSIIESGDTLIISFGHNDQKKNYFGLELEHFLGEISQIVDYCRKNQITIKIVTSISRRKFDHGVLFDTHGDYVERLRRNYSKDTLIDLNRYSSNLIEQYGETNSKQLFVHSELMKVYDDTHTSYLGASLFAKYVGSKLKINN